MTSPSKPIPRYALKGIAGLYFEASLHERPFLDAYREYVVLEGRDLRRWRLNLTTSQAPRAHGADLDRGSRWPVPPTISSAETARR